MLKYIEVWEGLTIKTDQIEMIELDSSQIILLVCNKSPIVKSYDSNEKAKNQYNYILFELGRAEEWIH